MSVKREMSLRGSIFDGAVQLFDDKLRGVLNDLLRQGLTEGSVTLKVDVLLCCEAEVDEDGVPHSISKPYFEYNVTSSITQKDKSCGEVKQQLKLRRVDGQLELRDLDENTLFDIVEGGANGGTDRA